MSGNPEIALSINEQIAAAEVALKAAEAECKRLDKNYLKLKSRSKAIYIVRALTKHWIERAAKGLTEPEFDEDESRRATSSVLDMFDRMLYCIDNTDAALRFNEQGEPEFLPAEINHETLYRLSRVRS